MHYPRSDRGTVGLAYIAYARPICFFLRATPDTPGSFRFADACGAIPVGVGLAQHRRTREHGPGRQHDQIGRCMIDPTESEPQEPIRPGASICHLSRCGSGTSCPSSHDLAGMERPANR